MLWEIRTQSENKGAALRETKAIRQELEEERNMRLAVSALATDLAGKLDKRDQEMGVLACHIYK